jgi:hypothetical protein
MTCAFATLWAVAHTLDSRADMRALIVAVLLLQAGGANGVSLPSQAILVARMPGDRLANIMSVMQMVSGTTGMVGMTVMLSVVRGWGVETDPAAFRPVWAMCAVIGVLVHLTAWTVKAGSQHKDQYSSVPAQADDVCEAEGEGDKLLNLPKSEAD